MNEQYPTPRSLKDDPPHGFNDILIADHTGWKLIGSSSEAKFFLESGYTHWLPAPPMPTAPPEPPEPQQSCHNAWVTFSIANCTESHANCLAFKAGWNAALEAFAKQWYNDKDVPTPLSKLLDKLKAP